MIKRLVAITFVLLVLVACDMNNESTETETEETNTFTYESETGPIEVPTEPERVVVLSGYTGDVIKLDVNIVGVDTWSKNNPNFSDELADVEEVSEDNLEKIIDLEPDLIITLASTNNLDDLQEIAPTVSYTWGAVDYLEQHIEIGKLLNKEEEATAWVEDFRSRAESLGEEIKDEIGEDTTVSVLEAFDKTVYVYGNDWARGTEILYQTMDLGMPEAIEEDVVADGYLALSLEVIPDYVGDYLVLSKYEGADTAFEETETFQNIPAVQDDNVIEMQGEGASFTDPITSEIQLAFFEDAFLGE
ncbi:iron complex transport system substrate-binding protein [Pelagirhabdus alkalitolerans]|uniref:Iron complex transport system substrate-binding protein n=1 Tax=Pelagirhabdus alkalitolerans TaxID=1612202 RepID=A0A1G6GRL1_9BACI|nr:iron-hydroxamate ABC transporter substrate-binding protein [Pelagirhabdus alkalitolerans]SDB84375.1 iron complex transport system substrate-binding protein [Pelagirhabdus alkalitolerans]